MADFAVIFDMDGVLVDSTKSIMLSFNQILNRHGVHIPDEEVKHYLGLSIKDIVRMWKEKYNVVFEPQKFIEEANKTQLEIMKKDLKVNLNLLKLLKELSSNNIPMGVGTSSYTDRAMKMLDLVGIRAYFSAISTAEEIPEHKPNPHIFLSVAEKLKVNPKNCVVIEDADVGIEAAKSGGMKSIGYLDYYTTKEKLKGADFVIENFSELSYQKIKGLF